ncbi:MAG: hypothetical protein BRD49_01660 [Bacteroidetes bacterium SW_10_40_5]|nr:MAG: hypothetical protein BRD49_01660 [Bacteroidetes bacterium SW_10_40_5]
MPGVIETTKVEILNMLKQNIRPEFLNRIDDIIMFKPLNQQEVEEIVQLQLKQMVDHMESRNIVIEASDRVIKQLARMGYEPEFGARPVQRVIQKELLNKLSKEILANKISTNTPIYVDLDENNQIGFENKIAQVSSNQ